MVAVKRILILTAIMGLGLMFTANANWVQETYTRAPEGHETTEKDGFDGMTNWSDDGSCAAYANAFLSNRSSTSGSVASTQWIRKKYRWEGTPSDGDPYTITKDVDIEVELSVQVAVEANDAFLVNSVVSGYGFARSTANASGGGGRRMTDKEEAKLKITAKHKPGYTGWTISIKHPIELGITIPLIGQETSKSDSARNLLSLGGGYTFSRDGAQIYASQYASAKTTQKNGDFGRSTVDAEVIDFSFD